jgi:hypothetical protein
MNDRNEHWPAWRYGPNGASGVFTNEKDVPAGWVDHPSKVKDAPKAAPVTKTPAPAPANAPEVDAAGHPWSPELHSATKSKTTAGLWRMKVGVSRPAPKIQALDL